MLTLNYYFTFKLINNDSNINLDKTIESESISIPINNNSYLLILKPKFKILNSDLLYVINYFKNTTFIIKNKSEFINYISRIEVNYLHISENNDIIKKYIIDNKFNWIHENYYYVSKFINYIFGNVDNLNKDDELLLLNIIFKCENTGRIGELIFEKYLKMKRINYSSQFKVNINNKTYIQKAILDFKDIDNNDYFEIKFGIYNMTGTAYEKILNVPHKYRNLNKRNLYIILIGKQEFKDQDLFNNDDMNMK
jgi:hypothetical protein